MKKRTAIINFLTREIRLKDGEERHRPLIELIAGERWTNFTPYFNEEIKLDETTLVKYPETGIMECECEIHLTGRFAF